MSSLQRLADKVKGFPASPGVYLMKDDSGRVLYVGKAKNLRNRAGHYFTQQALEDRRTADLVPLVADVEFIPAATEVDALLLEARLIKDIQPRFNVGLKDDKTFPYLQIRVREPFPRVEFTRSPKRGAKLYGPFTSARSLRAAIQVLQRIFKFRTCNLDIDPTDAKWRWFRPCLLASIGQCTAPCNLRVGTADYREQVRQLQMVLDGKKEELIAELRERMRAAAAALHFEQAAQLRDDLKALENLSLRGLADKDVQPEVFVMNPKRGVHGLKKVLRLAAPPRVIEGFDIAHLGGTEMVASMGQFIDGLPFKPGYRRFRIRTVEGNDDFASMREVVTRRYRRMQREEAVLPDLILIDGGKGQLTAAQAALEALAVRKPVLISLAKKQEEVYQLDADEPLRLSKSSAALRLLQYIRDEAHRFAQHYHHLLRRRRLSDS
ncbi:MAG TPA: excinuclease ABC subunit UvrC [Gemmatales bacterium]|nr:excinuclease ABC subunit UvrC [Gemmatales bacterium]